MVPGVLCSLHRYGGRVADVTRRWPAVGVAAFCAVFGLAPFAPSALAGGTNPVTLSPRTRLQQELAASQSLDYRITLVAGQAVTLQLEQDQNGVELRQIAPANVAPPRFSDAGRFALLQWTLIADGNATWTFRVSASVPALPARFRIELGVPHPVRADDRLRARAETALSLAETARRSGNAGRPQQAIADYQTAIEGYQSLHDGCGEQAAYVGLARYELDRGRYAAGQGTTETALRLHCAPGGRALALRALALRTLSSARFYQGDFADGVRFGQESLTLSRRTQDPHSQEWTLGDLVGDYAELGESARALNMAHAARSLALKLGDRRNALLDQGNIASIHLSRGELMPALEGYRESLKLLQTTPDPYLEGLVWTNLGMLYNVLGDNAASLDAYAKAIGLWKAQKNQPELSAALWNQGFVFLQQQQIKPACTVFQQALKVTEAANLENDRAHVLEGLGRCAMARSDWPRARDYFDQSLALAQRLGNPAAEIPAALALGDLVLAGRDFASAAARYTQAYELARRYDDLDSQPLALAGLARADRDSGDLDAARQNAGRALALIEDQRTQITDPDLRTDYFAAQRPIYALAIEILMRLNAERPNQGYALLALQTAERARARSLQDRYAEHALIIRGGVDPKLLAAEQAAEENLRTQAYRLAELPANAPTERRQTLRTALDQAAESFDEARGRLLRASPRFAELIQPRPLDENELRSLLPGNDTVILEYWLGQRHSYLWVVAHGGVSAHTLPPGARLAEQASAVLAGLEFQPSAVSERSIAALAAQQKARVQDERFLEAKLGRDLLQPALAALAHHRNVVVIADGELHRLPFGVLRVGKAQTMLGEDHDLVYLPSIGTLRLIRDVQRPASGTDALAIFADPVFRADDPRLPAAQRQQALSQGLAAVTGDIGLTDLPPLPYSLRGAEAIRARAGKVRVWLATGFAANRAAALHADWSRYAIVHFASHSLLDMQRPELSGIVLSLYRPDGGAVDGFLRVSDLYDLRMPVDLVVLGSCDSAVGPNPGSEGVFSLSRALFYAGARRTLASLWLVDDRATAHFMSLFYTALLTDHEAAPAAQRQARMEMAADPQYRQPYYWAGYVLQGDWQ